MMASVFPLEWSQIIKDIMQYLDSKYVVTFLNLYHTAFFYGSQYINGVVDIAFLVFKVFLFSFNTFNIFLTELNQMDLQQRLEWPTGISKNGPWWR